jgi:hypothetical protein
MNVYSGSAIPAFRRHVTTSWLEKNERETYFHGNNISVAHGAVYVTEANEMSLSDSLFKGV